MYGKIKIGDADVEVLASAATPYKYNKIFGEDLFKYLAKGMDEQESLEVAPKLAYVMNMDAQHQTATANRDGFEAWLEGFAFMDIVEKAADIIQHFMQTSKTNVDPK